MGSALLWTKLRDSTHPEFWTDIAHRVKDAEGTQQTWTTEEMISFFHNKVLNGIGQEGLQLYLQRRFKGEDAGRATGVLDRLCEQHHVRLPFPLQGRP